MNTKGLINFHKHTPAQGNPVPTTRYIPEKAPLLPPEDTMPRSLGKEFNLIALVEEHAPKRLEHIRQEQARLDGQLRKLEHEATQLEALIAALQGDGGHA